MQKWRINLAMKKMMPADAHVIQDLEKGAAQDVDTCTEVAKWELWIHTRW